MVIGIVILVVAVASFVYAALRVMPRKPEPVVSTVTPLPGVPRKPKRYAPPPVTLETIPPQGLVPPIDRNILIALAAGSRETAIVPRPERLAQGSIAPGYMAPAKDLDDDAETLGGGSDLDQDAVTRTKMLPVE
jgi:hypothetical protein